MDDKTNDTYAQEVNAEWDVFKQDMEARKQRMQQRQAEQLAKVKDYADRKLEHISANIDLSVGQVMAMVKRLPLLRRLELAFEIVFKRYDKGYDEYGQPLESDIRSKTAKDLYDKDAN